MSKKIFAILRSKILFIETCVPHIAMGQSVIVALFLVILTFQSKKLQYAHFHLFNKLEFYSLLNLLSGVVLQASYYKSKDINYCLQ